MILGFFEPNKRYSLTDMEQITDKQPEKGTWEMQWSLWFVNHGYEVKHYSNFDYTAFQNKGVEYIREAFGDEIASWQEENSDFEEAMRLTPEYLARIEVIPEQPTIQDIKDAYSNGYLAKVCVNQSTLNSKKGYVGHSVVVTGFDDENIWFHDPGLPALENRKVSHELFQKAMDSFGGEMDVIGKRK